MWLNFEECAINGISHAARAMRDKRSALTVIWTIVTSAMWGITVFMLSQSSLEYLSYPVLTTMEVEYQKDGVEFPTVSFCNHNPSGCDNLFRVSLDLPDLWRESGCSAGQQIESYLRMTLVGFLLDNSSAGFEDLVNNHFDKDASESAMTDLLAHLYVESPEVDRLMQEQK
jgi:hypothetical protein